MIEIGRLCLKTAGRDAGKHALVVDVLDNNFVLIDGETRRRKCNIKHLEPLAQVVKIKKNASHEEISKVLKEIKITALSTEPKEKKERPRKKRKVKQKEAIEKKVEKKSKKKVDEKPKTAVKETTKGAFKKEESKEK